MSEMTFRADAETLRILEKIGLDKKDDFINRAVKAYATSGGAFEYAAGKGGSGQTHSAGLAGGTVAGTLRTDTGSGNIALAGAIVDGDHGSQLNAELERLLGQNSGVTASLSPGNAQLVEFYNRGQKIASLELSECQSILKSLRPPISFAEVVEMLTLMSVG